MNNTFALIGYFTSWSVYDRGYRIDNLPMGELTHLNYAFANIKGGVPILGDTWADVSMKSGNDKVPIHYYRGKPYPKGLFSDLDSNTSNVTSLDTYAEYDLDRETNPTLFATCSSSSGLSLNATFTSVSIGASNNTTTTTSIKASPSPVPLKGNLGALLELKKKHPHFKTLLSIGGWTWSAAFKRVTNDAEARKKFSLGTKQLLTQYHFDGVDIDWEYPGNQKEHSDFVFLLKELRSVLGNITLISVALPCGDERREFRVKEIGDVVDFMNLMAYDFSIAGVSSSADHHSNLFHRNATHQFSVDICVQDYLKLGAPSAKIIMGVPFYGRSFSGIRNPKPPMNSYEGAGRGSFEKGFINYRDIDKGNVEWEEECKAAYVVTSQLVDKTMTNTHFTTIFTHSIVPKTLSASDFKVVYTTSLSESLTFIPNSLFSISNCNSSIPIQSSVTTMRTIQFKSMPTTSDSVSSTSSIDPEKTFSTITISSVSTRLVTNITKEWQTQVIFFDDQRALKAKADYVNQHSLGGMMFWDASGDTDDHQLIKQLHQQLCIFL